MKTSRLEAFSDGVLAIIITIMVLELKAPEEVTFESLLSFQGVMVFHSFVSNFKNKHHEINYYLIISRSSNSFI